MSYWKNKTVLVTGAGGFIGSHLTERLVELGARTRALVHYNCRGSWGWLEDSPVKRDIDVVLGDVGEADSVCGAVRDVEVIFHLAALIGIPYSYISPQSYVCTNVKGTLNLLQAAVSAKVECFVHTSTSEVYGTARQVPVTEDHPLQSQSPYSATKIGADQLAEAFHLSFNLPVATVRPFNTFGPRQSNRAVIPTIITQAMGAPQIRIGNLRTTRDFNYVADTVSGFLKVGESKAAIGKVVNIGSGRGISIGDLVELICKLTGRGVPIVEEQERLRPENSEVERLLAGNQRARELVGWVPQYSLEEGLLKTVEWIRSNCRACKVSGYAI